MIVIGICENKQTSEKMTMLRKIISNTKIKTSIIDSKDLHSSIPPRISLKKYIDELSKNDIKISIIKITPDLISKGAYDKIHFNIIVYDNIENEYYKSGDFSEVLEYKKIFESLDKNDIAIVNNDDSSVIELLKSSKMCVITYGFGSKVTITTSSIEQDLESSSVHYCIQRNITTLEDKTTIEPQEFPIKILSIDDNYVYALLATVTLALVCGIDIETISQIAL